MKKLLLLIGVWAVGSIALWAQTTGTTTACGLKANPTSNSPVPVGKAVKLNVEFNSNSTAAISWRGPNAFASTLKEPEIVNATVSMSGVYTVSGIVGTCTATATVGVVVVDNPAGTCTTAIVASSNGPVCVGGTLSLSASGGMSSYLWFGPDNFSSVQQNPSIVGASASRAGVYQVRGINANGCVGIGSVVVVVSPPPSVSVSANTPVCLGSSINLSASGGTTYAWTGPNNFSSTVANPVVNNAVASVAGIYNVVIRSSANCSVAASVVVRIAERIVAENNSSVCEGQILRLRASATSGNTYSWAGPNNFVSTVQSPTIEQVSTTNAGVYTLTVTGTNACTGTATTRVFVNAAPLVVATSNSSVCEGNVLILSAIGNGSISWRNSEGKSVNSVIYNATSDMSGIYTASIKASTGCIGTATAQVVIRPRPTVTTTSNSPVAIAGTIQLSATGGGSYAWRGPNGNGFTSTEQNPSITNATAAQAGLYIVSITGTNGCTALGSVRVIVGTQTTACFVQVKSNSPVCVGTKLELGVAGEGFSYTWTGPNGFSSTSQYPSISSVTTAATGIYSVVAVRAGCTATATLSVTVSTQNVVIPFQAQTVCEGRSIQFCPSTTSSPTLSGTYRWTGPNGFTSSNACASLQNITSANAGTYTLTVTSTNSCPASGTVSLTVLSRGSITASSNSPINAGSNISLSASNGAASYTWEGPNGYANTIQNPTIVSSTASNSGIYVVKGTFSNGCVASATTEVRVITTCRVVAANTGPVCAGTALKIYGQAGSTGTFAWVGPNGFTSRDQIISIRSAATANAGAYTLTFVGVGCTATATTMVSLKASPTAAAVNSSPVCMGESVMLSASGGGIYTWAGASGFRSTSQLPMLSNTNPSQSGIYMVTVTGTNGCAATATTQVRIRLKPSLIVESNSPVITGEKLELHAFTFEGATGLGDVSYAWTGPNNFASQSQNPTINPVTTSNAGVYRAVISGNNICSAVATTSVSVIQAIQTNSITNKDWASRKAQTTESNREIEPENNFNVYPNPVSYVAIMDIYLDEDSPIGIQTFDSRGGKPITSLNKEGKKGRNAIEIDFSEYQVGLYYVVAQTNDKQVVRKVVKIE